MYDGQGSVLQNILLWLSILLYYSKFWDRIHNISFSFEYTHGPTSWGVVPAKPFQHSVMLNCSILGAFIGDDYEENEVLLNVTRVTNTSSIFVAFYFTP